MSDVRPFFDATDIVGDAADARSRFDRDGYFFARGLLPPTLVEDLRRQFLAVLRDAGWIAADSPAHDQIADLRAFSVEPEPAYQKVYNQLYSVPAFHAMQHRSELLDLMGNLLDAPVIPQPRVIARVMFPERTAHTTPAHQDFVPVQGAADTVTAWIPLTDLSPEMGGLEIAAGSHRQGVFDFVPSLGASGTEISDPLHGAWVGGTFQQGDVLFFHSMTVHRGAPATGARLRLSVDLRFQRTRRSHRAGQPQAARSRRHLGRHLRRLGAGAAPVFLARLGPRHCGVRHAVHRKARRHGVRGGCQGRHRGARHATAHRRPRPRPGQAAQSRRGTRRP